MKSLIILFGLLFSFYQVPQPDLYPVESCLNVEERKLYDLIMTYRAHKKLRSIPISPLLTTVAQTHVRDLMKNFDYENGKGCNPHSWSDKGKWTPCCYTPDHESAKCMWAKPKEIAGYQGDGFEIAYYSSAGATAADGLEGWKNSPGHNPVLINTEMWSAVEWKAIGMGIYGNYAAVWFGEVADSTALKDCP